MKHSPGGKQLKYSGIPWITIKTPVYSRTPSTSGLNSPALRSMSEIPKMESTSKPIFNHSHTLFSDQEAHVIHLATDSGDGMRMHRTLSRLQNIQTVQQELHPELILGTKHNSPVITQLKEDETKDEDLESVISLDEDIEPVGFSNPNPQETSRLTQRSENSFIGSGPVTVKDIQTNVWDYCHSIEDEKPLDPISRDLASMKSNNTSTITADSPSTFYPYDMEFHLDDVTKQTIVQRKNITPGMRKKLNTIQLYSGVEKEMEELHIHKPITTKEQKKNLESSISAMTYANYILKNDREMPDFLDGLDFSTAKAHFHKRKKVRTQPITSRLAAAHHILHNV